MENAVLIGVSAASRSVAQETAVAIARSDKGVGSWSADGVSAGNDLIDQGRHSLMHFQVDARFFNIIMCICSIFENTHDFTLRQDMSVVQCEKQRLTN